MRLPDDAWKIFVVLGLSTVLAACGGGSGVYGIAAAGAPADRMASAAYGPEEDYPQVLGDPFTVEGQLYTPEDTYSYDAVGYATMDRQGGNGVSAAHKTLPMPSYVEVTSLETGRTILARVDRRGPLTTEREVALSPGAAAQLGIREGEPVRVRRVNPPEAERAELRMGNTVPERLATPDSLLAVLKRKLPEGGGTASLAAPERRSEDARPVQMPVAPSVAGTSPAAVQAEFDRTLCARSRPEGSYPLPPMSPSASAETTAPAPAEKGKFAVQAAAFASEANARRLAGQLDGGFVTKAGNIFRVRCGPYATRGQAEAALAKVRAAGYSDAQIVSAG